PAPSQPGARSASRASSSWGAPPASLQSRRVETRAPPASEPGRRPAASEPEPQLESEPGLELEQQREPEAEREAPPRTASASPKWRASAPPAGSPRRGRTARRAGRSPRPPSKRGL